MGFTKGERRAIKKVQLQQAAQECGYPLDISSNDSIFGFYRNLAGQMGIEVEGSPDSGRFRCKGVDLNGYHSVQSSLKFNATQLIAEIVYLYEIKKRGGPWEAGDLRPLKISSTSRGILDHEYGESWKARVSEIIAKSYANNHTPCQYRRIFEEDQRFLFKLVEGRIMLSYEMNPIKFKNDHVIMQNMIIPHSLHNGLLGEKLENAVSGLPWQDLRDARITKIEQMQGIQGSTTSVFKLESNFVPVLPNEIQNSQ